MTATNSTSPITPPHLATPVLVRGATEYTREFFDAVLDGFHSDAFDGQFERAAQTVDPARQYGFQVGDRWVATTASRARTMMVPGGSVAVNAVTAVTVAAPYRRRGLLTQIMHAQLREQTEPVALLWASEAAIYGRFGYGEATRSAEVEIPTRESAFRPDVRLSGGSIGEVDSAGWLAAVPAIREAVLPARPGALLRDPAYWERSTFDPPQRREGAGRRRYVLHYAADGLPDGYASFRIKERWEHGSPRNELRVGELEASTPDGYARLWRYLLDMDFIRTVTWNDAPADLPLYWMLADPRAMSARPYDGTYCRLVDLPAALAARSYLSDLDVVLDLRDRIVDANNGRFRLRVRGADVGIERTDSRADLALDIRELGSLYLGGVAATSLVSAGAIVEHRRGAAAALTDAFRWHRAPYCPDHF